MLGNDQPFSAVAGLLFNNTCTVDSSYIGYDSDANNDALLDINVFPVSIQSSFSNNDHLICEHLIDTIAIYYTSEFHNTITNNVILDYVSSIIDNETLFIASDYVILLDDILSEQTMLGNDQPFLAVAGLLFDNTCTDHDSFYTGYDSDANNDALLDINVFPVSIQHPFPNNDHLICEHLIDIIAICYTSEFHNTITNNVILDYVSSIIDNETLFIASDIAVKAISVLYYGFAVYSCPYVSLFYIAQKTLRETGALDGVCANEENHLLGMSICDILEESSHIHLLYSINSAAALLINGHQYQSYLKIASAVLSKAFLSTEAISMPGIHTPVITPYAVEKVSAEVVKYALPVENKFLRDVLSKTTGKVFKYASEEVLSEGQIPTIEEFWEIYFKSVKKGLVLTSCHHLFPHERGPIQSQLNRYCNVLSNKAYGKLSSAYGELSSSVFNQTL